MSGLIPLQARIPGAADAVPAGRDPAMWRAAKEFESVLLSELTALMTASSEVEAPFGGGHAEEVWRDQMAREMGKAMTRRGGIGLADHVYTEMLRQQKASGTVDQAAQSLANQALATQAFTAAAKLMETPDGAAAPR
jgi:Rod binding domain-containing protein